MNVLKKAIAYEDYLNMNIDINVDITFTKNLDSHGWAVWISSMVSMRLKLSMD